MNKRAGFTLVELLVVTVLGSLVAMAAYNVLLTNQRTYTAQNAQLEGQQTARAGADMLFGEFRELSRQGDIVAIYADSLRVRSGRTFGLVCVADLASSQLTVRRVGGWFNVGDSVVVYAENSTTSATDDDWLYGRITVRDTTGITCNGAQAQRLTIPVVGTAAAAAAGPGTPDSVRVGGNVRSFVHYRYGNYDEGGVRYLGRRDSTNTMTPIVGPIRTANGLTFRYLDSLNAVTSTVGRINQIEVTIRTQSAVRDRAGTPLRDSIKTRVFLRN
jgi:prepilin-type N-terminal cleavage/methylation domain-containing protein